MTYEIAKGYDLLAIDLENHIRWYVPGKCIEPISAFSPTPLFTAKEVRPFMEANRLNQLEAKLEELGKEKNFPYVQIKPWYVQEAIKDFFSQELYKSL